MSDLRAWHTARDLLALSPAARKELLPYVAEAASLAPPEVQAELENHANDLRASLQHDGIYVDN